MINFNKYLKIKFNHRLVFKNSNNLLITRILITVWVNNLIFLIQIYKTFNNYKIIKYS